MLKKIPNILTIGRIIIVPFFVLAFYLPGFYGDLTALILFIVASFTDFLDGMLARMMGEESKLGELLDPIADKIIVATYSSKTLHLLLILLLGDKLCIRMDGFMDSSSSIDSFSSAMGWSNYSLSLLRYCFCVFSFFNEEFLSFFKAFYNISVF